MTSSKYTRESCLFTVDSISSITGWNMLGVFFELNSIPKNLYGPLLNVNVALSFSRSIISIFQYPEFASGNKICVLHQTSPDSPPLAGLHTVP